MGSAEKPEKPNEAGTPGSDEDIGAGNGYLRIFRYATRTEYSMQAVATFCAVASGIAMAMVNLVFGKFITVITDYAMGTSTPAGFRNEAAKLALYFFIIGIVRFVLSYGYSVLFTLSAYRITQHIRYIYLKAGLSQEIAYFDAGIGGSIAMQATSNGKLIQAGISEKLGLVFQGLACFIAAFVLAFVTQWKLTLICCCIAPATLIVMGISSTLEALIETKILKIHAQGGSFAESILSSARNVQAFELRTRLVRDFDKFLDQAHKLGNKKNAILGCMFSAEYFIIFAGIGLCFWQAVRMIARGEVDKPGDVFIVLMSVIVASSSLTAIAPYLIDFSRAASAAAELFRLIDRSSAIDPFDESGEEPSEIEGTIDCDNLTFSYPMRPGVTVLQNFTLRIPAGKVTALVGASGSGKSTIIGLIERWYNPVSGTVKLDGRPIDKLNLQWLRKHVRLVQQEPVLFSGTVYDNIVNGLVGTPQENELREDKMARVQEAAKIAFAHDFISALPDGYDTLIGERGGLLSGGQKQRVAIARSVISRPRILLLDEATSALDPHAEKIVQQALDNVSKGRTTVTIAHKLATIRNADNIVVMDKGSIVEQGTHHSLLEADGAYARLVRAQDLSAKPDFDSDGSTEGDQDDSAEMVEQTEAERTLTRYSTTTKGRLESELDRDDFDKWKQIGFLHTVWKIVKSTPELRVTYLMLAFACLGAAGAYPGQAILMSRFIEVFKFTGSAMQKKGNFFALMFLAMAGGCLVVYFVVGFASNVIAQTLNHKYRKQIINDILRQDLRFFDRPENTTGALSSRVDSYPQAVFELMGFNIALIFTSVVGVLACCIVALVYGWRLGVVIIFAGLPPLLASGYARIRMEAAMDAKISKRFSMSASIASEAINAIRTISSLAIENSVLDNYNKELDHAISDSFRPILLIMLPFAFTQSVEYAFQALGFWYGCRLVSFGDLSMVNFFVAFLGVFFSGQQASVLFGFAGSMTKATNAANYLFWLEQLSPTIQETDENCNNGPNEFKALDVNKVQFSYPMRPDDRVLRGIDLKIKKGQFVAFVGASGCGKSTMIAMLERFYDPVRGHLVLDGKNLDEMNPWLYRKEVALVQQEPKLYPGTIRENISMGVPTEDMSSVLESDIIAACRSANAWDFISSLPEGLNTPCGSNGLQLSGGQRQRIAIARALIRKPRLLLLDEATSALDTQSERAVQDALNKAAKTGDRITIAVAHRLSTIRHADIICVFYGGKILVTGTHEALLDKSDMYRKMCEAQNLSN
ncbi:multidrug resistance protein [Thelonectria olida]|uniref:Multidrug resistance protein n=1 Tax=Thelonectria olida TaxID=1576542 RepID=A0A9P8VNY5_9HYPO|nr:multidrug resistance protein [Thelonectria olida]